MRGYRATKTVEFLILKTLKNIYVFFGFHKLTFNVNKSVNNDSYNI